MLADYLKAAIPRPVTLLGQNLHPFCLGHLLILSHFNCSFVFEGRELLPEDLALGVFVCCHSYEEALEALNGFDRETMERWRKSLGQFDFYEKAQVFLRYIAEGSLRPNVIPEGDLQGLRTPGTAFLQQLKIFLHADLHFSRNEAFNAPLGEALFDYYGFHEVRGRLKIYGPDEIEAEDKGAKIREAILAEFAAMGIELKEYSDAV